MLDQGLETDIVADIQKYLEDLISAGLRQRLITLIKVGTEFQGGLEISEFLPSSVFTKFFLPLHNNFSREYFLRTCLQKI